MTYDYLIVGAEKITIDGGKILPTTDVLGINTNLCERRSRENVRTNN